MWCIEYNDGCGVRVQTDRRNSGVDNYFQILPLNPNNFPLRTRRK